MKNGAVKVVGKDMEKMGEIEGLKMKNKGRFGVKVKKISEYGRFGEELKVLNAVAMEVLERERNV